MRAFFERVKKERFFAVGSPALIYQVIFFYFPLLIMIWMGVSNYACSGKITSLTLSHFSPLMQGAYVKVILLSIGLALATAVGTFFIAYPLSYFIAFQKKGRVKIALLIILMLPFWTNFLLHVYSWFFTLEKEGFLNLFLQKVGMTNAPIHFLNSPFSIIVVMVYHYLPFMVLPIFASLDRFDRYLLEASADLGASWGQTLIRVVIPLNLSAMRTGFFIVFISSFGEFIIPELMGGDKYYFVGNVITHYILGDQTMGIGAAFALVSFFSLSLVSLLFLFFFRKLSFFLTRKRESL